MKQLIALFLTLFICVSCVTPSHSFLAKKHNVSESGINMIQSTRAVSPYSPYFELKEFMEFTNKGITTENYDSVKCVYDELLKVRNLKSNCVAYDVLYELDTDTLKQRVYFIDGRYYDIRHDNDIIDKMNDVIKLNILRFEISNNHYVTQDI